MSSQLSNHAPFNQRIDDQSTDLISYGIYSH